MPPPPHPDDAFAVAPSQLAIRCGQGVFSFCGIPVALSTDDRGMWDSTMTDEFFVAVKEFNLSWAEIKRLSENSLKYAFLDEASKAGLLDTYRTNIREFEQRMHLDRGKRVISRDAPRRGFVCRQYNICAR